MIRGGKSDAQIDLMPAPGKDDGFNVFCPHTTTLVAVLPESGTDAHGEEEQCLAVSNQH